MTDYARWERFITDEAGNIVPTVSIEVRKESDGLLATIFSGRTGGALANPFTTGADGLAAFHAAGIAGGYQVRAYTGPSGAPTFETFFRYQPVGTAAEYDYDQLLRSIPDGTVGAPGLAFASDPDTGFYRIGANNIGVAVGGSKVLDIAAALIAATIAFGAANGAAATPSLTFASDLDSGIYRIGANNIGVAVGATKIVDIAATGIGVTGDVAASATFTGPVLKSGSTLQFQTNGTTFAGSVSTSQKWILGKDTSFGSGPTVGINLNTSSTIPNSSITNQLSIAGADNAGGTIVLHAFNTGNFGPGGVYYAKARGTAASPTATQSGDFLGQNFAIGFQTTSGSSYGTSAGSGFVMVATENYTNTAQGARLDIFTTANGAAATQRVANFAQGLFIGNATTDAGAGSLLANASIKSQGATAGIGYATGAGGTVTQSTNKSTAVTLNTVTGAITMNNASLNAGTIVSFVLNDSAIAATDLIAVMHESGGTVGSYTVNARATGSGTASIDVRNNTGGALGEALVLRFAVIKSVNT